MTTIPYHPSLSLGCIVDEKLLDALIKLSSAQAPVTSAQRMLNNSLRDLYSYQMMRREVEEMSYNISNTPELDSVMTDLQNGVNDSIKSWSEATKDFLQSAPPLRKVIDGIVTKQYITPLDLSKSKLQTFPLSADSLNFDVRFFDWEDEKQDSITKINQLRGYLAFSSSSGSSFFGSSGESLDATDDSMKQMHSQIQSHEIKNTLVIVARCTHKNARIFNPFELDPTIAISVWNSTFGHDKGSEDYINPYSHDALLNIFKKQDSSEEKKRLTVLAGANFGSSFVGMVHNLKKTEESSFQEIRTVVEDLQAQAEAGNWLKRISGGFGIDDDVNSSIKSLLSNSAYNSHANLIVHGMIPDIKPGEVDFAISKFADFNGAQIGKELATAANETQQAYESMKQAVSAARSGGAIKDYQANKITSLMSSLESSQSRRVSVIDVNTLMTAFSNFVNKASSGNEPIGVPITFELRDVTASDIARVYLKRTYPKVFEQYEQAGAEGKVENNK